MWLFILNVINTTILLQNNRFQCFLIDMVTYVQLLCTYTYVQFQDFFLYHVLISTLRLDAVVKGLFCIGLADRLYNIHLIALA